jgi:hypothetical protein
MIRVVVWDLDDTVVAWGGQPFPCMDDLLRELAGHGLRQGLATHNAAPHAVLARAGWADLFEAVESGCDTQLSKRRHFAALLRHFDAAQPRGVARRAGAGRRRQRAARTADSERGCAANADRRRARGYRGLGAVQVCLLRRRVAHVVALPPSPNWSVRACVCP